MNLENFVNKNSLSLILAKILNSKILDIEIKENQCFVKFDKADSISENDFELLEKKMLNYIDNNEKLDKTFSLIDLNIYEEANLCSKFFKIQKVAQEEFNSKLVQKITFSSFETKKELDEYLAYLEELNKYDHRYIGQNLNLFYIIPEAPGSVFWLPKGWSLYKKLEAFVRKNGYEDYQEVKTPFVMSTSFWEKSGHLAAFKKNMMFVQMGESSEDNSALKPMNCPGHIEIFKHTKRSYKELPIRLGEFGCCHRYEPSGSLHGLMRVRSLTIDDGHIFCSRNQIKNEAEKFLNQAIKIYKKLNFEDIEIILSTRPENFLGNLKDWDSAEEILESVLKESGNNFKIMPGDGAFYGPKIEMHVKDSMKRSWQLGTIQLDFVLPERFDLSFINEFDEKETPCMLHRAILGSMERFIGVLLEHTKGELPLFLHPNPVAVCSIVSEVNEYAETVFKKLKNLDIEVFLDTRSETLGYKIRQHKMAKVPMIIILGKEEMNNKTITLEYESKKLIYQFDELEKLTEFFK